MESESSRNSIGGGSIALGEGTTVGGSERSCAKARVSSKSIYQLMKRYLLLGDVQA